MSIFLEQGVISPFRSMVAQPYPASVAKRPFESIDEHTTHNWAESAEYSSLLFCQFIDFYAVVLCRENHDGSIRTDFIDGAHNRIHAAIFSLGVDLRWPPVVFSKNILPSDSLNLHLKYGYENIPSRSSI